LLLVYDDLFCSYSNKNIGNSSPRLTKKTTSKSELDSLKVTKDQYVTINTLDDRSLSLNQSTDTLYTKLASA
jgi:hypothetical protein